MGRNRRLSFHQVPDERVSYGHLFSGEFLKKATKGSSYKDLVFVFDIRVLERCNFPLLPIYWGPVAGSPFPIFWVAMKREPGVNPGLPRSGKQERTSHTKHWPERPGSCGK